MVVLAVREPYAIKAAEFANEDGQIFYLGALLHGPASIVEPYAGYLHVIARLLALPMTAVHVVLAPLTATLASFAVTAFVAAYMLRLPVKRTAALAIAAAILLLPGSRQTLGHLYGIQWYLAMLLIAGAFVRPNWWDYPLLGLISVTGPFSVLFLPIYLWFARDWRAVVVGAGATVQLLVFLISPRYESVGGVDPWIVAQVLGDRGVWERIVGERLVPPVVPLEVGVVGILAVLTLVVVAAGRPTRAAIAITYAALATAMLGILFAGNRGDLLIGPGGGGRYFLMPGLLLVLAAIAGLHAATWTRRVAGGALIALLTIGMIRDFHVDLLGPQQGWRRLAPACIGSPDPCVIPVFPPDVWSLYWPGAKGTYRPSGTGWP